VSVDWYIGTEMKPMELFEITTEEISVDEVVGRLAEPAIGAVVTFVGLVRGETDGREVRCLEYEAYPEMAEETLRQIGDRARWETIRKVARPLGDDPESRHHPPRGAAAGGGDCRRHRSLGCSSPGYL